jgi:hypothetical protein
MAVAPGVGGRPIRITVSQFGDEFSVTGERDECDAGVSKVVWVDVVRTVVIRRSPRSPFGEWQRLSRQLKTLDTNNNECFR